MLLRLVRYNCIHASIHISVPPLTEEIWLVQNDPIFIFLFPSCIYTIDAEWHSEWVEGDSFKMVPTWCATGNTFSNAEHYWKWSPQWCSAMHDGSSKLVASKCTRMFMGETDRSFGSNGWIQSSSRETKEENVPRLALLSVLHPTCVH